MSKLSPVNSLILKMHQAGHGGSAIAAQVGLTPDSVWQRLYWLKMSPERLAEFKLRKKEYRKTVSQIGRTHEHSIVILAGRPSAEMIAERNRRFNRPYSVAIDLLGEPEPGRSALDQMHARGETI